MLIKHAKPSYRKWLKRGAVIAFVVEGIFFVAGYTVWTKVNTERDFRLYLRDNYPSILEIYYKTGEYLGSSQTRSIDLAYWESQADSKKSSA